MADQDRDDIDSVELSNDMQKAAEEEEARRAAAAAEQEEDDDDDDFDLLGDDDDDDEVTASADDDDDDEDDEDDEEESTSVTAVPKVARKKPGQKQTAKERIEELAAKKREAEAEAFKAEMRLIEEQRARQELEERIAALETGRTAAAGNPQSLKKPDPEQFKYGEVDPAYIDATVEWRLAEERDKFQKTQEERAEAEEHERLKKHYQSRLAKVSEEGNRRFQDFDKIVNSVDFPGDVARDILDSDQGVDISYYLGKNVSKLREMSLMSPAERARAMGRLEERFSARSSAGKKTSKAPATPGRKAKRKATSDEAKYGPENQDDFDRAFYGR